MPEDISITLFGPGVELVTNAKLSSGMSVDKLSTVTLYMLIALAQASRILIHVFGNIRIYAGL